MRRMKKFKPDKELYIFMLEKIERRKIITEVEKEIAEHTVVIQKLTARRYGEKKWKQ